MPLQMGSLRDALLEAKVTPELASKAAEEIASYETAITRHKTLLQVGIGLTAAILLSQVALWTKLGELSGQSAIVAAQMASQAQQLAGITQQLAHLVH